MFQVCTAWEKVQLNDSVKKKLQFNISSIKKIKKKKKKSFFFFFLKFRARARRIYNFFLANREGVLVPVTLSPQTSL